MGALNDWCFIYASRDLFASTKKTVWLINPGTRRARWIQPFLLSPAEAHFFGYCAVTVGVLFAILYLYTRSVIAREKRASPPRFLESEK